MSLDRRPLQGGILAATGAVALGVALVEGTVRPLSFARNAFFVVAGVGYLVASRSPDRWCESRRRTVLGTATVASGVAGVLLAFEIRAWKAPISFVGATVLVTGGVGGVLLTGRGVAIGWGLRDADPT